MSAPAPTQAPPPAGSATARRTLQRVVFPSAHELDTVPLYLDHGAPPPPASEDGVPVTTPPVDARLITGRRTLQIPAGERASLATYFNAFPASYWRRWTIVSEVTLRVRLDGPATVIVYRSDAQGNPQRVEVLEVEGGEATSTLSLAGFGDGGWYWFDVYAAEQDVQLLEASWEAEVPERTPRTASIGITTFNQPDYCLAQLEALGSEPALDGVIDRIYVVDQGTKRIQDHPDYAAVAEVLGDRLRVVLQGNLGGSGGFARGMYETVRAGESDFVLLMDDDVLSEPEGIVRAVTFGDLCRKPTLVGGHMFSMYERAKLHAFGEAVNRYRFFYAPAQRTEGSHDFSNASLRATPALHARVDVDYNAWWMCLIPTEVIREIGLSLPIFIKWDDAEYGLRAKRAGFPTVTLPGAAVWHVPFSTKDDTIDWQAYFHQRNRWVAALLHSPYDRGGRLPRESLQIDVKHLLSLQYSAVELRLRALEDLLEGPEHLHRTIGEKLPAIRSLRATFTDAVVEKDPAAFPDPAWVKPPRKGQEPTAPSSMVVGVLNAFTGAVRQLLPLKPGVSVRPEATVPAVDAKWWRLSHLDSAIVSSADGTGASWYVRDPKRFRAYVSRSMALHQRLLAGWSSLQRQYQDELAEITSPARWEQTFEASFPGTTSRQG